MSKRSKRHHFVPKALQKYFCCDDGKIWYSQKGKNDKFLKPEKRNTTSTFQERNYYTVQENGRPSDIIEREFYGKIDNFLGEIIPYILECLDNKKTPIFDKEVKALLKDLVHKMIMRTPDFVHHDDFLAGRELIEDTISEAQNRGLSKTDIAEMAAKLGDVSYLKSQGRNIRIQGQISSSEKIDTFLKKYDFRWGICTGLNSLILSSRMVYRLGNGSSNGLKNHNTEIWFPLSPRVCLVLLRDKKNRIPTINEIPDIKVQEVNEYAAENSLSIASNYELILQSAMKNC